RPHRGRLADVAAVVEDDVDEGVGAGERARRGGIGNPGAAAPGHAAGGGADLGGVGRGAVGVGEADVLDAAGDVVVGGHVDGRLPPVGDRRRVVDRLRLLIHRRQGHVHGGGRGATAGVADRVGERVGAVVAGGGLVGDAVIGGLGLAVLRRAHALHPEGPVARRSLVVGKDVDGEGGVLLAVDGVVDGLEGGGGAAAGTRARTVARSRRGAVAGSRGRAAAGAGGAGPERGDGSDPVVEVGLGGVAVGGGVAEREDLPVRGHEVVALPRRGGGHV